MPSTPHVSWTNNVTRPALFWLAAGVMFVLILALFREMLAPFVVGMILGYFLDPVVDRLQKTGLNRGVAAILVLCSFLAFLLTLALISAPLLQQQFLAFTQALPDYIERLRHLAQPFVEKIQAQMGSALNKNAAGTHPLGTASSDMAATAFGWVTSALRSLWDGGLAVIDLLSFLFITPIVAFYMLRDWDQLTATLDGWLPRRAAPHIRSLLSEMDLAISGFLRGQAIVCVLLGAFYAVSLSMYGLNYGFFIGFAAGLLTFMPYVGTLVGFACGIVVAYFQFDAAAVPLAVVAGIFALGQFVEGNILTPRIVGDRVGLHAVWIIFALLAGGHLFGFVGVLVAVPVAAIIGVLIRFGLRQYLVSAYYLGTEKPSA